MLRVFVRCAVLCALFYSLGCLSSKKQEQNQNESEKKPPSSMGFTGPSAKDAREQARLRSFKTATLILKGVELQVELARSPEELSQGLMFRTELAPNKGMLFVYDRETPLSFWMKNTFIPLSIGFFNKERALIDVQDMEPVQSEIQTNIPSYQSRGPAMYALEVQRGWFAKHKIPLGAKFTLQ